MPRRLDLVIAFALTALVVHESFTADFESPARPLAAALGGLITLPLVFRRTHPLATAAASVTGFAALGLVTAEGSFGPQTVLLPLAVAAYTAGSTGWTGLAVLLTGVFVAEPGDVIVLWPIFAGAWFIGRLMEIRQEQAAQLAERATVLERDQAEHARLAIEEERARIARDLHDVVAHSVSVMVVQAGAERLALGEERPQTREALAAIERTGRHAMVEMRRLVGMLRSADEEIELAPLPSLDHLEKLAERMTRAGLPVDLRIEGERRELPPGIDISGYRVVQEALTNALKHAGPATATVRVHYGASELDIEVVDDGHGGGEGFHAGHGLTGMRERVAVYGGELAAEGNGRGFRVRARLPIGVL